MTWKKLDSRRPSLDIEPIKVRVSKKGYNSRRLIILVGRMLAKKAGWAEGISIKADVFIGDGFDSGFVKITNTEKGDYSCSRPHSGGAYRIVVVPPEGMPSEYDTTPCQTDLKGNDIIFQLPWHKTQETKLKTTTKPTAIAPKQNPAAVSDQRPAPSSSFKDGDPIETSKDHPLNGSAPTPASDDSDKEEKLLLFEHKGKSCKIPHRQYRVAAALYKALGKGFIDNDRLMKAASTKEIGVLQMMIPEISKIVEPLGLRIGTQPKMGFYMAEQE